jgi:hypothetical protein
MFYLIAARNLLREACAGRDGIQAERYGLLEYLGHTRRNSAPVLIQRGANMSFGLYALGFLVLIAGLIYGAHLMHMPAHWIAVGAIVLLGIGIVTGVQSTRQKDPS